MHCHSCGTELSDDAEFCSSCGTEVDDGETAGDQSADPSPDEATEAEGVTTETDGGVGNATATSDATSNDVVGGLEENVAGALAYVFLWVSGLVFYFVEEDNEFVRFHAVQSIVVFGTITLVTVVLIPILGAVFGPIPVLGGIMHTFLGIAETLVGIGALVLWIILIVKAYQGERYHLPTVGEIAEEYV